MDCGGHAPHDRSRGRMNFKSLRGGLDNGADAGESTGKGCLRTGHGYDVHPLSSPSNLLAGGTQFSALGLQGHSDADVIAHSVADACSGRGEQDLGTLFPARRTLPECGSMLRFGRSVQAHFLQGVDRGVGGCHADSSGSSMGGLCTEIESELNAVFNRVGRKLRGEDEPVCTRKVKSESRGKCRQRRGHGVPCSGTLRRFETKRIDMTALAGGRFLGIERYFVSYEGFTIDDVSLFLPFVRCSPPWWIPGVASRRVLPVIVPSCSAAWFCDRCETAIAVAREGGLGSFTEKCSGAQAGEVDRSSDRIRVS